jgi:N-acetyl-alpha-D-glucosaminyl L-malate synthase BshA
VPLAPFDQAKPAEMTARRPLKVGIVCYPTVGGSGILASALGEELAERGHEVHFISSERPFRFPEQSPRVYFHPVSVNKYELFRYPDYTLPLSVKMAEVSRDYGLDVLHAHYAVPHATSAILARSMLPSHLQPRVVTTLHGTDTTLLGRDANYGPAIRHALDCSDAVTAVSEFLKRETHRLLDVSREVEVIHNFYAPREPRRTREAVRNELGVAEGQVLLLHSSNLRSLKRVDLLLAAVAAIRPRESFKLMILAGEDFSPFTSEVRRLGLQDQVIVLDRVKDIEDYLQAADLNLVTSESESFCLSILEAMCFGCPSVAMRVGGIPEVIDDNRSGQLVPFGETAEFAAAVEALIRDAQKRLEFGRAGQAIAQKRFSAEKIVPKYESLYYRICAVTESSG